MSRVATLAAGVLAAAGSTPRTACSPGRSARRAGSAPTTPVTRSRCSRGRPTCRRRPRGGRRAGPAGVVAVLGSGAFGALDDLAGDGASKGLKGHLGAAAQGRVTTGLVKIVGIGATGLVAAALADRGRDDVRALDTLVGGAVVAGAANLANLLDLRPGRALKVTVLAALPLLPALAAPQRRRRRRRDRCRARRAAPRPRRHRDARRHRRQRRRRAGRHRPARGHRPPRPRGSRSSCSPG